MLYSALIRGFKFGCNPAAGDSARMIRRVGLHDALGGLVRQLDREARQCLGDSVPYMQLLRVSFSR
jgi:hypothetical protein